MCKEDFNFPFENERRVVFNYEKFQVFEINLFVSRLEEFSVTDFLIWTTKLFYNSSKLKVIH